MTQLNPGHSDFVHAYNSRVATCEIDLSKASRAGDGLTILLRPYRVLHQFLKLLCVLLLIASPAGWVAWPWCSAGLVLTAFMAIATRKGAGRSVIRYALQNDRSYYNLVEKKALQVHIRTA